VRQGLQVPVVSSNDDQTYVTVPGFEGMQFVSGTFPFFDNSTPATQEFHAALAKYSPEMGSAKYPLSYFASKIWTSGKLFEAAVKAAPSGAITSASIKQGLYALKNETLGGLTGPLNFSEGKVVLDNCFFTYVIKNGNFAELNGMTPTCAPASAIEPLVAKITAPK
jgi:branched-chain amino acid transport system substrate-binding protein